MILNNLDLQILRTFNNIVDGQEIGVWQIMKKIYPDGSTKEYVRVVRRMDKMSKYGFFIKNGHQFVLISDLIKIEKFKFPDKKAEGIAFRLNNMWNILEV